MKINSFIQNPKQSYQFIQRFSDEVNNTDLDRSGSPLGAPEDRISRQSNTDKDVVTQLATKDSVLEIRRHVSEDGVNITKLTETVRNKGTSSSITYREEGDQVSYSTESVKSDAKLTTEQGQFSLSDGTLPALTEDEFYAGAGRLLNETKEDYYRESHAWVEVYKQSDNPDVEMRAGYRHDNGTITVITQTEQADGSLKTHVDKTEPYRK